ncbi:replication-associated recombination protein A [Clostridium sp. MD294]|uniref:replication-associated recombination protein A n=1 Tax=Clostridium sp. MD294 TaxID=97138 RepID=UPI0002C974ED|nr:replication-associated recombination protein A [Clostridium sp. MD294]NDO45734.1 replication-associated recombination protein A [Clostridium sp. MD294]USF30612.1 putative AAA domain-containing protein [Clostridium sp. MD294]
MDLFEYNYIQREKQNAPLASRMRPVTLEEFIGQEHIIAKNKLLYRAIQCDRLSSIILYGPPGTGKTTLAKIIANTTKNSFQQLNATTSGIKDIKETIEKAKITLGMYQNKTILFIDEIHRFNKTQQDALLPYVEDGTIILIGATTENPYFEVNKALVSRSVLFELKPLTSTNIKQILQKALENTEKGLGNYHAQVSKDAIDFLADISNGDARTALNALELAVLTTQKDETGTLKIDLTIAQDCIQKRALNYDKNGDNHYDTISAFIKSIRGSDPHAALYYLAKMLYAGEDPKFIARRIVIAASEDIGNADPHALQVAVAAAQAVHFVGMPECRITLAQAVTYLSCAPKSNACYMGIEKAMKDVIDIQIKSVPSYLKDCHYSGAKKEEGELNYQYPHDFLGNYVKQQYLPDELIDRIYYEPTENGVEKRIKEALKRLGKGVVNGTNGSK